jgi:hypothetical protein
MTRKREIKGMKGVDSALGKKPRQKLREAPRHTIKYGHVNSLWLCAWRKAMRSMNDTTERPALPDRLSVDPRSRFYNAAVLEHEIGIKHNDKERSDVEEYCISEGWISVPAGKALDRKGNPLMIKLKGKVEAFYK